MEQNIIPMPEMNLNLSSPLEINVPEIANSDQIISTCKEIIDDISKDREEIDQTYSYFLDLITNGGDATTSSKEAVVQLLKLKSDQSDKKMRITELLVSAFLKQKYAPPRVFSAYQHNEINVEDNSNKKGKLLRSLQEKGKKDNENK